MTTQNRGGKGTLDRYHTGRSPLALGLLLMSLGGCSVLCHEDRRVAEITFGHPAEEIQREQLARWRREGFECADEGTIRNALGHVIGARYVCTRCR